MKRNANQPLSLPLIHHPYRPHPHPHNHNRCQIFKARAKAQLNARISPLGTANRDHEAILRIAATDLHAVVTTHAPTHALTHASRNMGNTQQTNATTHRHNEDTTHEDGAEDEDEHEEEVEDAAKAAKNSAAVTAKENINKQRAFRGTQPLCVLLYTTTEQRALSWSQIHSHTSPSKTTRPHKHCPSSP